MASKAKLNEEIIRIVRFMISRGGKVESLPFNPEAVKLAEDWMIVKRTATHFEFPLGWANNIDI